MVEGKRAIRRALECNWELESVLLFDSRDPVLAHEIDASGVQVLVAPRGLVESVTGFPFHRGVLAIGRRRVQADPREIAAAATIVLVVEGVNDHENLGSLFRNAAAFGAGAVLLDPACCDPLYRRSVRVSLGNVLAVPFATLQPWPGALADLSAQGFSVLALTPAGDTPLEEAATSCSENAKKVAVVVGSEGEGLSEAALACADIRVRIPIAAGVDSLNVATAAAVALARLRPSGAPPLV